MALSARTSEDPPRDDPSGPTTPAGDARFALGDILFLQRHGLGELRGTDCGHLRPPYLESAGVRS